MNCLTYLFIFSLVPRCQGEYGSAKKTLMPVLLVSFLCLENSLPLSKVAVMMWSNKTVGNLSLICVI